MEEKGASSRPDATPCRQGKNECQVRAERGLRDVDLRLATPGHGLMVAGKEREGGVREDSVFESR